MGLEDTPDFPVRVVAGRFQSSRDFFGMVGIVVNDGDAAHSSLIFEAAVSAFIGLQRFYDNCVLNGKPVRQRDGSHGIEYIVLAGHPQGETAFFAFRAMQDKGGIAEAVITNIGRIVIRSRTVAEGDDGSA